MNTTEVGITVYEETNVIECPRCAKHLSFDDLVQKEGNSGCIAGKQWHSAWDCSAPRAANSTPAAHVRSCPCAGSY